LPVAAWSRPGDVAWCADAGNGIGGGLISTAGPTAARSERAPVGPMVIDYDGVPCGSGCTGLGEALAAGRAGLRRRCGSLALGARPNVVAAAGGDEAQGGSRRDRPAPGRGHQFPRQHFQPESSCSGRVLTPAT
jgi:predicted NBD/HSP70 family sugar kinase